MTCASHQNHDLMVFHIQEWVDIQCFQSVCKVMKMLVVWPQFKWKAFRRVIPNPGCVGNVAEAPMPNIYQEELIIASQYGIFQQSFQGTWTVYNRIY